jgi:protein-disulfide isomerase
MVFRNFAFLGAESTAAAEAADCAQDQGKLWPYHDALYTAKVADVQKGGAEDDGFFNRALFLQLAQKTGLDIATFTSCIDSNKYASQVASDTQVASGLGVNSTPTFFINGTQILGAEPYASFEEVINAALK